ncbi:ornithine carbamoyltransferase [Candidatus Micrarchaeota archaeon]|nr:ornithine carbamoyltransferase [Candidatus Micrarchaeota archaeon]
MARHFLTLNDVTNEELKNILNWADEIKKNPGKYSGELKDKTLLMIFAKPSLRTRVSFEVGITQLGGHGIYYDISTSPMGKKETIGDTAKTSSRYVDIVMARLFEHSDIEEYAENSDVPVINALTNFSHPCQIVADLQTIKEKKGELMGLKLAYLGDSNNNVTHSLICGCTKVGMNISVGCPKGEVFMPQKKVVDEGKKIAEETGGSVTITHNAEEAVKDADVVYTDSWMSYHIKAEEKEERMKTLMPYQVNRELMDRAKPDAIFMNCLPAMRGMEQTAEVIDGPQSVVFDEAENRLHAQKAVMLFLLGKFK